MVTSAVLRSFAPLLVLMLTCLNVGAALAGADAVGPEAGPLVAAEESEAFSAISMAEQFGDALTTELNPAPVRGETPLLQLNFQGTSNPCAACVRAQATGDIGAGVYVQAVNGAVISIYTRSGVPLPGYPKPLNALWTGHPGRCDQSTSGNPVVIYDDMASRWLLAQSFEGGGNGICVAVSKTSDPAGAYHLYEFSTGAEFPQGFKFGAWSNAYYMSSRESTYAAYAFNRARMLAGKPASFIRFAGESNFLLPADVDGNDSPKATAPGLFYTFKSKSFHGGADRLELFSFHPDFAVPSNSTFRKTATFGVEPFTYTVCGLFNRNCIAQQGTAQKIDARSEWPSSRLAYRTFANGNQSLAGTFTVRGAFAGASTAAVRWFELRNFGSAWSLQQEGTIDSNDGVSRFNGSIAIDQAGNLALGYSVSAATMFPAIRYAMHFRNPAVLGVMTPERTLFAGSGAQTGSNRWGGSMMSVDAESGAFWYTGQYYPATAPTAWTTRVGKFRALQTVIYRSVAANDGDIVETAENSGIGGAISPASIMFRLGDTSTNQQIRAILDFDTDSLPDTAVIAGLDLRIKRSGPPVGDKPFVFASEIEVHENLFSPAFSGNVALQSSDFEVDPGGPVGLIRDPPVGGWYIANPMEDIVKKIGHTQFRLQFNVDDDNNDTADVLRFHSGDATAIIDRPRLSVTYYVP